jgi:hypothetical protein
MRVPSLDHDGIHVWDTLAIGEYLNEIKPKAGLLPADRKARAHCRAICGEMHSGFSALRSSLPMNIKARFPGFKVWSRAQADIDRALEYAGALFKSDEWERSYTVMESRVGVTWLNNSIGAVAYLEALIFSCGYEEPDVDAYFSPETWDVIFQYYDDYEIVSECRTSNGLRLYEVDATNSGFEYDIRYWARNDTDNRVITMMMTFPVGTEDLLADYATRLFPPLPDCNN